jgi:hypothetical protein
MEIDDDNSRSCSSSRNHPGCYTTLIGSEHPKQLVDCQIILVNPRQRFIFIFF